MGVKHTKHEDFVEKFFSVNNFLFREPLKNYTIIVSEEIRLEDQQSFMIAEHLDVILHMNI